MALTLGALLHSSNEAMHAEVGQVQRPGAELGDDRHLSTIDRYCQDWSLSFNGRCPDNGWLNCRSVIGID